MVGKINVCLLQISIKLDLKSFYVELILIVNVFQF